MVGDVELVESKANSSLVLVEVGVELGNSEISGPLSSCQSTA